MPLRILIHGINFTPELVGIGKYTGEMAAWLAGRGHEVHVVTAPPYYPAWRVERPWQVYGYDRDRTAGARVRRCPLYVPRRATGLRRLAHLASFAASSAPVVVETALRVRPHVVLAIAPALASAPLALLAARLSGARAWIHIQDFEVEAAFGLGLLRGGALRAVATRLEGALLRSFDRASSISEAMVAGLRARGVPPERAVHFPNWVDTRVIRPLEGPAALRAPLGIGAHDRVILYAGNMGEKQGLEVVLEAARRLRGETDVRFVLCGEGAARARLVEEARGLPNVAFLPLQPAERLNDLLALGDVHLVPQRPDVVTAVMPSKLTGILAAGRPAVAVAAPGTPLAQAVLGCGLATPPGDAPAFAAAILRLARSADERARLGAAARARALERFGADAILGAFERALRACVAPAARASAAPASEGLAGGLARP